MLAVLARETENGMGAQWFGTAGRRINSRRPAKANDNQEEGVSQSSGKMCHTNVLQTDRVQTSLFREPYQTFLFANSKHQSMMNDDAWMFTGAMIHDGQCLR
jgi:hypothetical protein